MAERPVTNIVQECRHNQDFSVMRRNDLCESWVFSKLPQVLNGIVIDPQSVLKPIVYGSRVDARRQRQLSHLTQSLEFSGVHDGLNPWRKWDIQLDRNADNAHG
jgi:hypothetical protein